MQSTGTKKPKDTAKNIWGNFQKSKNQDDRSQLAEIFEKDLEDIEELSTSDVKSIIDFAGNEYKVKSTVFAAKHMGNDALTKMVTDAAAKAGNVHYDEIKDSHAQDVIYMSHQLFRYGRENLDGEIRNAEDKLRNLSNYRNPKPVKLAYEQKIKIAKSILKMID